MKFALIVCIITLIIFSILGLIFSLIFITNSDAISETLINKQCKNDCSITPIDMDYKTQVPVFTNHKFDKNIASYCLKLINAIYYDKNKTYDFTKFENLTHELTINDTKLNKLSFSVIWRDETNKTIWIIFRGTDNIKEWYNNFKISQSSYNDYDGIKSNLPSFMQQNKDDIKIHKGFLHIYTVLSKTILNYLEPFKKYNIILSGHSLGASIANIFNHELNYKGYTTVCYLFGSPRVGNYTFCELLHNNMYRVENTSDIIPTLPTSVSPNFSEPEKPYFYSHCGNLFSFTTNLKSLQNNHSVEVYNMYIKSLL